MTYKDIYGWMDFYDLYYEIYKSIPENGMMIEVGAFLGKSTAYMCHLLKKFGDKFGFITVDTWEGSNEKKHQELKKIVNFYDEFVKNMTVLDNLNIVTPWKMTSLEAAQSLPLGILDCVFLDGSHEYEDVMNDIEAWLPRIKPGGILAGHDVDTPEVWKALAHTLPQIELKSERCWLYRKPNEIKEPERNDRNIGQPDSNAPDKGESDGCNPEIQEKRQRSRVNRKDGRNINTNPKRRRGT